MPTRIRSLNATFFACCAVLLSSAANAQTVSTTLERGLAYLTAIEELDTKYDGLRAAGNKLIAERQDTLNRLVQTNNSVSQILQAQAYNSLLLAQAQATCWFNATFKT
jgi:hypothetical protein